MLLDSDDRPDRRGIVVAYPEPTDQARGHRVRQGAPQALVDRGSWRSSNVNGVDWN